MVVMLELLKVNLAVEDLIYQGVLVSLPEDDVARGAPEALHVKDAVLGLDEEAGDVPEAGETVAGDPGRN